jgi:hypothetical protein
MADMPSVGEAPKLIGDPVGTFYGWVSGFIPKGPLRVRFAPFCARLNTNFESLRTANARAANNSGVPVGGVG